MFDVHPILLRNITIPQSRKPILVSTSIRRLSQFGPSLLLPKSRIHSQQETTLPPPKPLTIPALESLDTLSETYPLSYIDSTTFSPIYPRLPPESASKHTTSALDNHLEISSESTFRRPPRHRYILRYNRNPTTSLASPNSSL